MQCFLKIELKWTKRSQFRLCRPGDIALSTSRTHVHTGGNCIIDIVGLFVRVSCATETQTEIQTKTDKPRQTIDIARVFVCASCPTETERLIDRDRRAETDTLRHA